MTYPGLSPGPEPLRGGDKEEGKAKGETESCHGGEGQTGSQCSTSGTRQVSKARRGNVLPRLIGNMDIDAAP